jgi:polysaccharide pyruvyl transferase WcaK-like protein
MATMQIRPSSSEDEREMLGQGPRIALITPYDGGNLGDAAIQDAMISNLRLRMPGAQFLGITLNCDNFLKQHGVGAYPLLAKMVSSSSRSERNSSQQGGGAEQFTKETGHAGRKATTSPIRRLVGGVPGLVPFLKWARAWVKVVRREISHCYQGYRVLRTQDALFISGGGQLDEEYGGPWRLPYTIFKWTLLARLARVPCAMASIGAGRIISPTSRRFVSLALGLCSYRSFREQRSRTIVANIFPRAVNDSVVPDLAFSMPESELQSSGGAIRRMAGGRPVVALSPIAYGKPVNWPTSDRALYGRYVKEMAEILRGLSRRGNFIVVVCSSLGDDESVIPDILERLDEEMKHDMDGNIHFPKIKTWREFATVMRDTDYLIASRLHGTILGFLSKTPVIAISFDPKVDWVMEDLQQNDCLLHIRDFTADDVMHALDRVKNRRDVIVEQIVSYRRSVLFSSPSARQYDLLAGLALQHHQSHN